MPLKPATRKQNSHTIDVEEEKASSIKDTISAGGTRYIVNVNRGLKFYGASSQADPDEGYVDNISRVEIDNISHGYSAGGGSFKPGKYGTVENN